MKSVSKIRRRQRGFLAFTLLEVIIALVLTSGLVFMSLRWVAMLGELTVVGGEAQDPSRVASYAMSRLETDVESAGSCDVQKRDVALAVFGPDRMSVYLDDNADGVVDLVTWRVVGDELRRGVNLGSGTPCVFDSGYTESKVAGPLVLSGDDLFVAVSDGALQDIGSEVDCQAGGWRVCAWDAVKVDLTVANGSDRPARVQQVLSLRPADHRN